MKYFHRELSNLIGWFEQVMVQTHLFELSHVEPANCDITLCGEISWIQGNGRVEVIHGSLPLRETHTHKPTTHYTHTHNHYGSLENRTSAYTASESSTALSLGIVNKRNISDSLIEMVP